MEFTDHSFWNITALNHDKNLDQQATEMGFPKGKSSLTYSSFLNTLI